MTELQCNFEHTTSIFNIFFPVGNLKWMIEEAIYVRIYSFRNPEYLGDNIRLEDKINNTWLELYFCPFFSACN